MLKIFITSVYLFIQPVVVKYFWLGQCLLSIISFETENILIKMSIEKIYTAVVGCSDLMYSMIRLREMDCLDYICFIKPLL